MTARPIAPYSMSPQEVACGWVGGFLDGPDIRGAAAGRTPRQALEDVVAQALAAPPCFVAFSGGRDSSLVLAVAVDVARRQGLPAPIAVTERFPGHDATEDEQWQELVIRHLALEEWIRFDATAEVDLLGEHAKASLRRFGLLWPPLAHTRAWFVPELARSPSTVAEASVVTAAGASVAVVDGALPGPQCVNPVGTLVDGEGGDELLGARRLAPLLRLVGSERLRPAPVGQVLPSALGHVLLSSLVSRKARAAWWSSTCATGPVEESEHDERPRRQCSPSWSARHRGLRTYATDLAVSIGPAPLRRTILARRVARAELAPWLRAGARSELVEQLLDEALGEPLWWPGATRRHLRHRGLVAGMASIDLVVDAAGARAVHPLLDPGVVDAVAEAGGRWGFPDRASAMGALFADIVPAAIQQRTTKARFNTAVFGEHARAFAARWDGTGLDHALVDPEQLVRSWQSERPSALGYAAMHAAWLASPDATAASTLGGGKENGDHEPARKPRRQLAP